MKTFIKWIIFVSILLITFFLFITYQEEQKRNVIVIQDIIPEKIRSIISDCHPYKCFSDIEFVQEYNDFEDKKADLEWKSKYILNNFSADSRIQDIAKLRGYQKRPFAFEGDLVPFEDKETRPELRDAFVLLEKEMKEKGIKLHFVSGYRSSTHQRNIFKSKLGYVDPKKIIRGILDDRINKVLDISALPAYSKHHSGYAVDFGCGDNRLVFKFAQTECYNYLSENNFMNAKRFGFIPSYPDNAGPIGPKPEPWEFVWVGEDRLFSNYYLEEIELENKKTQN